MNLPRAAHHFLSGFEFRSTGKWFVLSTLIGIVGGLGAIAFQFLTQIVMYFALGVAGGYHPREAAGEPSFVVAWLGEPHSEFSLLAILGVMILGGLLSGWLVYTFAPEAEGHGTDAAIDSFHHKRGFVRGRIPLIKTITSAITLGTGGSGGREGPIAQIGSGFGSFLATRLGLSARERRIMLCAGMGAGVGAIFRAPLAGALFAGEILYKEAEIESDVIVPSAISSIIAYSVYCLSLPPEHRFSPLFGEGLDFAVGSLLELLPLALLALILTLSGIVYIKVFYGLHNLFKKLPIRPHFRPAIGAGLAGLVGIALFQLFDHDTRVLAVLSAGYGAIQEALEPGTSLGVPLLLTIAIGKVLTTSFTIGSGGSGGVFGPSMVIGGCVGAAIGQLFHSWWPETVTQPGAYVIVGMAGFFAGCAHAPISTILMVFEMTGTYKLLLPTMWVSTLCFLLCRRWTLYHKQLPTRLESPAHRGDFIVDVLEGIRVADVYRHGKPTHLIPRSMPLDEVVHLLPKTEQNYFPVVDEEENVIGIFSARDVRSFLYDDSIWHLTIAQDVMVRDVLYVTPEDSLNTALRRFTTRNIDEVPVMDPKDPRKIVGMLRRKEVIAFYNQRLTDHQEAREESSRAPA